MSKELANTLALWLFLPGMAVFVLITGAQAFGTPRGTRRKRHDAQLARLRELSGAGDTLELDWLAYKEIPKSKLLDVLAGKGWEPRGETIGERAWTLRFARRTGAAEHRDARARLADELAAAEPGVDGRYLLDASRYPDVPLAQVRAAAESAGWQVRRVAQDSARPSLELARPRTTTVHDLTDGPFAGTSTPAELRADPVVSARAADMTARTSRDPLSEAELDRARKRHAFHAKRFNRQGRLAFLYGMAGLFVFIGTVTSTEGGTFWILLAVSLILFALFGLSVAKATAIRRQRRAEIGDVLDDYGKLRTEQV